MNTLKIRYLLAVIALAYPATTLPIRLEIQQHALYQQRYLSASTHLMCSKLDFKEVENRKTFPPAPTLRECLSFVIPALGIYLSGV